MLSFSTLSLFLSPVVALLGSSVNPANPASSVLSDTFNFDLSGVSPDLVRHGGPWHWNPGHGGGPGWGDHPNGPGNCVQIQNKFPAGTNGPGSKSANRANAVKVCCIFRAKCH